MRRASPVSDMNTPEGMSVSGLTPQQIAERCAAEMLRNDHAAQSLGVELLEIAPGTARMRMTVRQDMANGHGICHGGLIFTIADEAFAYACNTFNHNTVAADADISFLAPAHIGDVLVAHAHARQQGGRNGIYDIEVTNQEGKLIALFRGRSSRIKGQLFGILDTPETTTGTRNGVGS